MRGLKYLNSVFPSPHYALKKCESSTLQQPWNEDDCLALGGLQPDELRYFENRVVFFFNSVAVLLPEIPAAKSWHLKPQYMGKILDILVMSFGVKTLITCKDLLAAACLLLVHSSPPWGGAEFVWLFNRCGSNGLNSQASTVM